MLLAVMAKLCLLLAYFEGRSQSLLHLQLIYFFEIVDRQYDLCISTQQTWIKIAITYIQLKIVLKGLIFEKICLPETEKTSVDQWRYGQPTSLPISMEATIIIMQ